MMYSPLIAAVLLSLCGCTWVHAGVGRPAAPPSTTVATFAPAEAGGVRLLCEVAVDPFGFVKVQVTVRNESTHEIAAVIGHHVRWLTDRGGVFYAQLGDAEVPEDGVGSDGPADSLVRRLGPGDSVTESTFLGTASPQVFPIEREVRCRGLWWDRPEAVGKEVPLELVSGPLHVCANAPEYELKLCGAPGTSSQGL